MSRYSKISVGLFFLVFSVVIMLGGQRASGASRTYYPGVGDRFHINTSIKPDGVKYKWKTSNGNVAKISRNSNVYTYKKGTTVLTLNNGNKAIFKCKVIVGNAPKTVKLNKNKLLLYTGATASLNYKFGKNTYSLKNVYTSSNKKVVTVNSKGVIKTIGAGKATVALTACNGKKAVCKITVKKADKVMAVTFDDGPVYANTKKALDALAKYGYHSTFFMVGYEIAGNESLLKRMANEGHELGIHTWDHPYLTKISVPKIKWEINSVAKQIKKITGNNPTVLRPPYGAYNDTVLGVAGELGYPVVLWSMDTQDWRYTDVQLIKNNILNMAHDGAMTIIHDLRATSVEALVEALPTLQARGYRLVTASELAKYLNQKLKAGQKFYGIY